MTVPEPRHVHHDEGSPPSSWCGAAVPDPALRADVFAEVHRWCTDAMTADDDVTAFGSAHWCALPDGPTKTRAAIRAALAWWTEQWTRADADAEAQRQASHAISAALDWTRVSRDLAQRRDTHSRMGPACSP